MINFSKYLRRSFVPVARFAFTTGLSLCLVMILVNYTSGFFHTENLLLHFDAQDSARRAIEQIRQDIQRAGFSECNSVTRTINDTRESRLLMQGVVVEDGGKRLQTAYLMPLLPASASLELSPTRNTLYIRNTPDPGLKNLQNMTLFVGNCVVMDQVKLSDIPFDGSSLRLVGSLSDQLINQETGRLLDNVRLYELRESVIYYSPHTTLEKNAIGDGVPALYLNDMPFVTGVEEDGFSVIEHADGLYTVVLNFNDDLYKGGYGGALNRFSDAGIFTFRVMSRNVRKDMRL